MFAFIAAITQAAGILIDKITLTRQRVEVRVFIPIAFIFLFLFTVILWPWFGAFSSELFTLKYQILFWSMIAVALVWNFFYYRGAQAEKIHDFELIVMGQPLVTILLASIFLKNEQNWMVVVASIIAAVALIFSRIQKEHVTFSKEMYGLLLAVVLMSIELIIIDLLLAVISPVAIYAVRTGIMAIIFYFFFQPRLKMVSKAHYGLIAASAALGVVQMVTKFYGFQQFGVVFTSLILIFSPVLVYITSTIWMHERVKIRQIFSGLVILACIIFATVLGK